MTGKTAKRKPLSFEDRVLFMVRGFIEYGTYGRNLKKAIKLLHKYHPGVPLETCEYHFNNYVKAYNEVIDFVDRNREYYWQQHNTNKFFKSTENSEDELIFINNHGDVPAKIINGMIGWVFFWHHLK
jgi:hypothetical protein